MSFARPVSRSPCFLLKKLKNCLSWVWLYWMKEGRGVNILNENVFWFVSLPKIPIWGYVIFVNWDTLPFYYLIKLVTLLYLMFVSDTMGNKGAFISITGDDLTPKFTSYDSVVSYSYNIIICLSCFILSFWVLFLKI